ncbi:Gp15 family bacteriophage protein [Anaerotaenia torta]|uniref:Gp15 family bacteriophage protein n=1 Tax=Anaerotaenia torta TaxID=433293 RepID=UPI003D1F272E
MIGQLPKELKINSTYRAIRSDYRVALLIFQACGDPELSDQEKVIVMIECLYQEPEKIPPEDYQAANDMAVWFLEGGEEQDDSSKHQQIKKVMDWEQDEKIIFSAVNKVAGFETRAIDYMHWWTFLGYFNEIGEGLLSTVINIRAKKNKGKKLEKYEQEFYRNNKALIDLKVKLSEEEQAEIDYWNKILG